MDDRVTLYEIQRRGMLYLEGEGAPNGCKAPGATDFRYVITVRARERLDTEGFVIDHNAIAKAAEGVTRPTSCEVIARRIEEEVYQTCYNHGVKVRSIRVQIAPPGPRVAQLRYTARYDA